jgi:hypothetical protein
MCALELASIDLSEDTTTQFTADSLWVRANAIVGSSFGLVRSDFDIVLRNARIFISHENNCYSLRP